MRFMKMSHSPDDAAALQSFTELLLTHVITLPGMLEAKRKAAIQSDTIPSA